MRAKELKSKYGPSFGPYLDFNFNTRKNTTKQNGRRLNGLTNEHCLFVQKKKKSKCLKGLNSCSLIGAKCRVVSLI